jgi:A/G-specific adenine glycosylase
MIVSQQKIKEFQKFIFVWWRKNRRDLPWRQTYDPYKIMVSEVMLQQTQVDRVLTRYTEFIQTYPTVTDLAKAKVSDILRLWKGMGYNRRALYLKKAAEAILEVYKGVFPASEQALLKLSGIGTYTARAILVFSFKQDSAMVDTNIRKIITHFFFHDEKQPEKVIQEVADQLVPKGKSWEWHQALMDFGAIELSRELKVHKVYKVHKGIKSKPFKETNRFFRGRMMDFVREKNWKQEKLIRVMVKQHGKDIPFYEKIIEDLLQEGLLTRSSRAIISLPE